MAATDTSEDEILDEEGDGARSSTASAKSGRGKLILFALIGLLVVGSAAGGAFVFLGKKDTQVAAEDEPPVIEAPRKITYIEVDPIFIQVETGKGVLQNIVVALSLEVELGNSDAVRVQNEMPRLS